MSLILGLTGGLSHPGQDASAVLINNGKLIFAMEEERLTRVKHAPGVMPILAIKEALAFAKKKITDVDKIALYADYPEQKKNIKNFFNFNFGYCPDLVCFEHHLCHAASAYYPSGFDESIIITADFSGNGISTAIYEGRNGKIKNIKKFPKPNSLGIFYSLITQSLGFNFDNDEYKVMGLASYGKPNIKLDKLITFSNLNYKLNNKYLDLLNVNRQLPLYNNNLLRLLNLKKRYNPNEYNKNKLNIAATAQDILNKIVLNLVADSYKETKIKKICFAGGVFLNCQTIMKVSKLEFIENIFVQPASSDAGAALGAAILASNKNKKYQCAGNLYLGNNFTNRKILKVLKNANAKYVKINKKSLSQLMIEISKNKIFAIFKGRHEFGPRALGNRSIMASPKNKNMKNILNMKIKFREAFRPFAPIIREIDSKEFFHIDLPYKVYNSMNVNVTAKAITKKKYPSVVHVDGTSRVQIIRKTDNKFLYELLTQLKEKNNIDCLINTSFNLDKMPIVNTPVDALSVFFAVGIDYLILGDFIVLKKNFSC